MKNLLISNAIMVLIFLTGCYTGKKAQRQVIKAQSVYPEIVATLCSDMYPPLTLTKDSIVYKKGRAVMLDTLFMSIDCDTVIKNVYQNKVVRIPCPSTISSVDTVIITKERQVVNKARVKALGSKVRSLELTLEHKKSKGNILLKITVALTVYTILRWVLLIWKIRMP